MTKDNPRKQPHDPTTPGQGQTQVGSGMSRRTALKTAAGAAAGAAAVTAMPGQALAQTGALATKTAHGGNLQFPKINPRFMITPRMAMEWNAFKSKGGPTFSGSPGWIRYTDYMLSLWRKYGIVDIEELAVPYERYVVDDWPDPKTHIYGSGVEVEKLISGGTPVPVVATYGMTSGFTGPDGVTAPMLYYDPLDPPPASDIAGKILVFDTAKYPAAPYTDEFLALYTPTDYEFRSPGKWWRLFEPPRASEVDTYHSRWVFSQLNNFAVAGINGNAAAMVIVYDLSPGAAFGLIQRSVYTATGAGGPGAIYINCPTLCLDRVNGAKVLKDALAGKTATLTLRGRFEHSVGKVYVGYLPGKNYGTSQDEQIMLGTHSDAMSLVEDNGGLGMAAIAYYFNHIPQSARPRTLTFYIDCRHFMPGGETSWGDYDFYAALHPEKLNPMVCCLGLEHMGGKQTIEIGPDGNEYTYSSESPSDGGVITSLIDIYNNNIWFTDVIAQAAADNHWVRVYAKAGNLTGPSEPGIHGGYQGEVLSEGNHGRTYGFPGVGLAGDWPGGWTQSYSQYSTEAGPNGFDPEYFVQQVAGLCQIAGEMMLVAPIVVDFDWGNLKLAIIDLPDVAFVRPLNARHHRRTLVSEYVAAFDDVVAADYATAKEKLELMLHQVSSWIVPAHQSQLLSLIRGRIARLQDPNRIPVKPEPGAPGF